MMTINVAKIRPGRSQCGYSLLELVISISVGTIVVSALGSVLVWTVNLQQQVMTANAIEGVKQNILRSFASDQAWMNTVFKGSSNPATKLDCLQKATSCKTAEIPSGTPFALYNPANELVVDGVSATSGFTRSGTPCSSFDGAVGNDDCPFRYETTWRAVCDPTTTCLNPQIVVSAILKYQPKSGGKVAFDLDRFSINPYYLYRRPACGSSNTRFFTSSTNTFVVPQNYRAMIVEVWGAGGGGASVGAGGFYFGGISCTLDPGGQGGATSFGGLVSAGGGRGGPRASANDGFAFGVWIPNFGPLIFTGTCGGSGSAAGAPGAVPNKTLGQEKDFPLCHSDAGAQGGWGGPGAGANGSVGGGGGGNSDANTIILAGGGTALIWTWNFNGQGGNWTGGNAYDKAWFTPQTLPPGAQVTVTVGAGGAGGVARTWGGITSAGRGGDGLVKVTWW